MIRIEKRSEYRDSACLISFWERFSIPHRTLYIVQLMVSGIRPCRKPVLSLAYVAVLLFYSTYFLSSCSCSNFNSVRNTLTVDMVGHIVVAGDMSIGWLTFPMHQTSNEQPWQEGNLSFVRRRGGAVLLTQLLIQAETNHGHHVLGLSSEQQPEDPVHSIVDLVHVSTGSDGRLTFKVDRPRHIHTQSTWLSPTTDLEPNSDLRMLVVQDSCNGVSKHTTWLGSCADEPTSAVGI